MGGGGREDPRVPSQSTPGKQRTRVQAGTRGWGRWDTQREELGEQVDPWSGAQEGNLGWGGSWFGASEPNGCWKPPVRPSPPRESEMRGEPRQGTGRQRGGAAGGRRPEDKDMEACVWGRK